MGAKEVQDHELDAWLDVAAEDMTPAQRAEFGRLVRAYHATQVGRDGQDADWFEQDNAVRNAALNQALGELDVAALGRAYRQARTDAHAGAVIAALAGTSEVQAARDATIQRRTLRRLLRKRTP